MADDEFPECSFYHDNIETLYGVKPMPVEDLPTVCTCGRPLTYADEVLFVSFPVAKIDGAVIRECSLADEGLRTEKFWF